MFNSLSTPNKAFSKDPSHQRGSLTEFGHGLCVPELVLFSLGLVQALGCGALLKLHALHHLS